MFFKIKALAQKGKKIILHYFDYNPLRNAEGLEHDCIEIHTYHRKPILNALPLSQPFIIQSRINEKLVKRLNEDNHPILMEGLHCTGIIEGLNNHERIIVRMHNEEAFYYKQLAQAEQSFIKRQYFLQESKLLKQYQQHFNKHIKLACLSETDMDVFQNQYGFQSL